MKMVAALPVDFKHESLLQRVQNLNADCDTDLLLFRVFEGDEECGMVALRLDGDDVTVELDEIFVRSDFRGRGLGGSIIDSIVEVCMKLGRKRIAVWAQPLEAK